MEGDLRGGAVQMVGSEGTEAFEVPGAEWGGVCPWGGHLDQITQG